MGAARNYRGLLAIFLGVLLALVLLELGLRVWSPVPLEDAERTAARPEGASPPNSAFQQDEILGFKPVLDGTDYGTHGAVRNEYALEKRPGVRRLLFVGDSATHRGQIVAGLRAELGEGVEYWNAGVEGYSTFQELEYYRQLESIHADHVVLTFHLNDYGATPVAFQSGEGVITMSERRVVSRPIGWLWRASYLYRLVLLLRLERPEPDEPDEPSDQGEPGEPSPAPDIHEEIARSLVEFRDLVRSRGAEFSVIVLPWLRARSDWPWRMVRRHADTLALLEREGIRHYSFLDELAAALAEGEPVQEVPRDPQHPSAAFGRRMARSMLAHGFTP